MKVVIELDLRKEAHREILATVQRCTAPDYIPESDRIELTECEGLVRVAPPVETPATQHTVKPAVVVKQIKTVMPKIDRKRRQEVAEEALQASHAIEEEIGAPKQRMSRKERASIAAKARWAKAKEETPVAKPVKKNGNKPALEYEGATKRDASEFKRVNESFEVQDSESYVPDGRELIEGTWERGSATGDILIDDMRTLRGED